MFSKRFNKLIEKIEEKLLERNGGKTKEQLIDEKIEEYQDSPDRCRSFLIENCSKGKTELNGYQKYRKRNNGY